MSYSDEEIKKSIQEHRHRRFIDTLLGQCSISELRQIFYMASKEAKQALKPDTLLEKKINSILEACQE